MRWLTPLFHVLLLIETSDLIFAILGLRSLYFVLKGSLGGLAYLKPALAAILVFVGGKMLIANLSKIPPLVSLGVILAVLAAAGADSTWAPTKTVTDRR